MTKADHAWPRSWAQTTVGEAVTLVPLSGRKLKTSEYAEAGQLAVIDQGQSFVGGFTDSTDLLVKCDLPVIVFGDHTRVFKYVNQPFVAGADGIRVMRPLAVYDPKLFFYLVQAAEFPDLGYARHYQHLRKASLPLPPLAEQRRIVAKLEELLTRLEAGVAALLAARAQIARYRQAVLRDAFSGRLTAAWRERHRGAADRGGLEPASALLERLRAEREAEGRQRKPLPPLDASALPELPEGWMWARVGECVDVLDNKRIPVNASERDARNAGRAVGELFPYYGATGQVGWIDGYLFDEELVLLGEDGAPFLDSDREKSYIIRGKSWVNNHAHVLRTLREVMMSGFLCRWLNICDYRPYVTGTTRLKLTQAQMRRIHIPIAPLREQQAVMSRIEEYLSVADAVERQIEASLAQAERLRQAILKRAFEGRLVPQDPSDEPASELLARIQAERAERDAAQPARRSRKAQPAPQERLF
jgi:type I restriction enzyme S subunit